MKVTPKKEWFFPDSAERGYAKFMVKLANKISSILSSQKEDIEKIVANSSSRMDDDNEQIIREVNARIEIAIDGIEKKIDGVINNKLVIISVRNYADDTDRYNKSQFNSVMESIIQGGIADKSNTKHLTELWVQDNLRLIKSIKLQTLDRIRQKMGDYIANSVDSGTLTSYLEKDLQNIAQINKKRAELIARDQVGKLNSRLTRNRQQKAGIDSYKWSTSGDKRVRPAHRDRSGKIYFWDSPPPDGHPGEAVRCRCSAIPVIDLDNMQGKVIPGGLGATVNGSNQENTVPKLLGRIDYHNEKLIQSKIKEFEEKYVSELIEHAMIITKEGLMYHCEGTSNGVELDVLGDELVDAYVTHNHPEDETEYSFSDLDLTFFKDCKLKLLRGVDHKYEYELSRDSSNNSEPLLFGVANSYQHNRIVDKVRGLNLGYRRKNT